MGSRRYEYSDRRTIPKDFGPKQTVEEFLAKGGEITEVPPLDRPGDEAVSTLRKGNGYHHMPDT